MVRHAWGKPCHLARLPIGLTVRDRAGRQVRLLTPDEQSGVGGDFSPGSERLINITYLPTCKQRGPFVASVNVGPYFARRALSANDIGCFTETRCEYASLRPTYLPWRKRGKRSSRRKTSTDRMERRGSTGYEPIGRDAGVLTTTWLSSVTPCVTLSSRQARESLFPGTRIREANEPGRLYPGEVGFSPSIVWFLADAPSCEWLTLQLTAPGMSRLRAHGYPLSQR